MLTNELMLCYLLHHYETINLQLMEENWDDILWLVATIKLKENMASQILKRLNMLGEYDFKNKLASNNLMFDMGKILAWSA